MKVWVIYTIKIICLSYNQFEKWFIDKQIIIQNNIQITPSDDFKSTKVMFFIISMLLIC